MSPEQARRIALLIGNGDFTGEPRLANLLGPANDVRSLGELLGSSRIGGFEVHPVADADSQTIQRALEQTLSAVVPDDLVLIYYSGHGKLDSRGNLCLAARNTSLDALRSTSVPVAFVKSVIDDCRSERVVLMLDCCFSGAAGKSFGGVRGTVEDQLSATRGAGLHILTSSTAIETSHEREDERRGEVLGNFTRCIVDGIRTGDADVDNDARITLGDLRAYLEQRIRGQSPKYWGFEASGQIVIANNDNVRPATLPPEFVAALESPIAGVREGVARELARLLASEHKGLALAARNALTRLADDDSRRVSEAATGALRGSAAPQRPFSPANLVDEVVAAPIAPPPPAVELPVAQAPRSNELDLEDDRISAELEHMMFGASRATTARAGAAQASISDLVAELPESFRASKVFFLKWMFLTAVGLACGFLAAFAALELVDSWGKVYVFGGDEEMVFALVCAFGGSLAGIAQSFLLRGRLANAGWWSAASICGWAIFGGVIGPATDPFAAYWPLNVAVVGVTAVSTFQWLLLRKDFSGARWWIIANVAPLLVPLVVVAILPLEPTFGAVLESYWWGPWFIATSVVLWLVVTGVIVSWLFSRNDDRAGIAIG